MFQLKRTNFEAFATIPQAFPDHELDLIRDMIASQAKVAAVVGDNENNKEIRDSRIKWIEHGPKMQWLFERLASIITTVNDQWFGMDLTQTEQVQLTEYDAEYQGFYGAHIDSSYGLTPSRTRKLSVTMQLSDPGDYEGGDLLLYPESLKSPVTASRERGTMTVFRSHIIHEVTPVTKGIRYSFVTWVHGPLFK